MTNPGEVNPQDAKGVFVDTRMTPAGTYTRVVSVNGREREMSREEAIEHALAVAEVAARSRHDAAVLRQYTENVGMDLESSAHVVSGLRQQRKEVAPQALLPLELEPVLTTTGEALVRICLDGEELGVWTVRTALSHALACLAVAFEAPLHDAVARHVQEYVTDKETRGGELFVHQMHDLMVPLDLDLHA